MAPAAGAMTNQSAIVASNAVPYPNGLMPTLFERIPAKIIISHALKKKNPPAAGSEKNGRTAFPLSQEEASLAPARRRERASNAVTHSARSKAANTRGQPCV
jgi:hypothetical protein